MISTDLAYFSDVSSRLQGPSTNPPVIFLIPPDRPFQWPRQSPPRVLGEEGLGLGNRGLVGKQGAHMQGLHQCIHNIMVAVDLGPVEGPTWLTQPVPRLGSSRQSQDMEHVPHHAAVDHTRSRVLCRGVG